MSKTIILQTPQSAAAPSDVTLDGPTQGHVLLQGLLQSNVVLLEDWQSLPEDAREWLLEANTIDTLLPALVENQLLTEYQAARVLTGDMHQLVLGNYRILERIGAGGMGIVYRGEHHLLRRPVAIKVLQTPSGDDQVLLQRFFTEMRALARIRHNNIVCALDAGTIKASPHSVSDVHFFVMEYVKGMNLEQMVAKGPLSISQACDLIYQIAGALDETNKINLIHRDIKPSNILLAPDGTAKLLDFGLALHFGRRRLTAPGVLLGTISYMAPEQVADAAHVDIRADIYGLGTTFYYCLTGTPPFAMHGHLAHQVSSRLTQPPPALRAQRPDVSADLENIARRMMAHHPDDRYPTPQSVMRAFLPYVNSSSHFVPQRQKSEPVIELLDGGNAVATVPDAPRILIVDDEPLVRDICKSFFRRDRFQCSEANDGAEGLQMIAKNPYDLVLLDIDMPRLGGIEMLRRVRQHPSHNNLKIIMMSGGVTADEMSELLEIGADDYLTKPLSRHQLVARTKAAIQHKATQDRTDILNQQLLCLNTELEQSLNVRSSDLVQVRNALVYTLAKIVESRSGETANHLTRMTHYASHLARHVRRQPRFANLIDESFLKTLESSTILHDIGNVALPDHILRRCGALDSEDTIIMQSHTTIGGETLKSVSKRDRGATGFWQMATDIARHHHERFDGRGFPDRLTGNDIPLAARIVALADAYDGLRAPGTAGLGLSHNAAVEMILEGSRGRFDPLLLQAFRLCQSEFEGVYRAYPETA